MQRAVAVALASGHAGFVEHARAQRTRRSRRAGGFPGALSAGAWHRISDGADGNYAEGGLVPSSWPTASICGVCTLWRACKILPRLIKFTAEFFLWLDGVYRPCKLARSNALHVCVRELPAQRLWHADGACIDACDVFVGECPVEEPACRAVGLSLASNLCATAPPVNRVGSARRSCAAARLPQQQRIGALQIGY